MVVEAGVLAAGFSPGTLVVDEVLLDVVRICGDFFASTCGVSATWCLIEDPDALVLSHWLSPRSRLALQRRLHLKKLPPHLR